MRLSKRRRGVLYSAGIGVLFVATTVVAIVVRNSETEIYRPGEQIDGLSSLLARDLPPDAPEVVFTDVTESAGIRFRHFHGHRTSQLPEDMGSGAAWGDYDNDGWPDLYVVNLVGPIHGEAAGTVPAGVRNHLYRNRGDGTFEEVAEKAGVAYRGVGMGAAWGDYDGDGFLDLAVTNYGEIVLYRNNGDGTFTDRSSASGIGGRQGFWSGPVWGDFDGDGRLDLYVPGYVRYDPALAQGQSRHYDVEAPAAINPSTFGPEPNLLFHNQGNGTFREVALSAGVANDAGRSLAAAWVDVNLDGRLDLYVANDVSDNVLYLNEGNGLFRDVSYPALVADYRGAMGIAVGDWNGDGDPDLFITHWIAQENALYENLHMERSAEARRSGPRFMDVADRFGLGQIALDYVGWGTSFLDFDNDGRPDLFVVNGSTLQDRDDARLLVPMTDHLFWNGGPERGFFDVSGIAGAHFSRELVGRGAAVADFDRDGDLDLFIVNHGGEAVLLRNDGGNRNAWLQVALDGTPGKRPDIGTSIRVVSGASVQVRQVGAQASYCSQNDVVEHFGLGSAGRVDSVIVTWPGGVRQVRTDLPVRRLLKVRYGESE